MVKRAVADVPKDSSLGVSTDTLKTNTLKTHRDPHTIRGRPTLKDVERFWNSIYYGLALRKKRYLQNAVS